jgi:GT2 family glycosyltransferase
MLAGNMLMPKVLPVMTKVAPRMNVHIVVPSYNHWELTHELIWNLYRKERMEISSLLIVDNGSTDKEVADGLKWWTRDINMPYQFPINVLRIEENCGFLLASNRGLQDAVGILSNPGDIIILLSNDVQIHSKFIWQIRDILESKSRVVVGGKLYTSDTGWNTFGAITFPYLEGWLLATRACDWYELGYFDPIFAPQDYEDIDFSVTAFNAGYDLVPLNNVGLVHKGAATYGYNPEREANTIKNKEKFRQKWIK